MSNSTIISRLKLLAKRLKAQKSVSLTDAQNELAHLLGQTSWPKLQRALGRGWVPGPELEWVFASELPEGFRSNGAKVPGEINGHSYDVYATLDDIIVQGKDWSVEIGEAPSMPPRLRAANAHRANSPLHNPVFASLAITVGIIWAEKIRDEIRADWKQMHPNEGLNAHPLGGTVSDRWECLHCDAQLTTDQLARNLWHCPNCHASPLDILVAHAASHDTEEPEHV